MQEGKSHNFDYKELVLILVSDAKKIIFGPLLLSLCMGFFYSIFFNDTFISSSKIISSSSINNTNQASGLASQFGLVLPQLGNENNWVYPEIIKSSILLKNLLNKPFSTQLYGKDKLLKEIIEKNKSLDKYDENTKQILLYKNLVNMVEVFEDIKTNIYTIKVAAFEPSIAKDINNQIILELDRYQKNYNKQKASKTRKFIEERIINTEKELIKIEEDLKNFNDRNRRIGNSPALQLEQQRLNREVSVLTSVFTTLKQQYETTKIEEVKDEDYVIIINPPEMPIAKSNPGPIFVGFIFFIIGSILTIFFIYFRYKLIKYDKKNHFKEAVSLLKSNFLPYHNK